MMHSLRQFSSENGPSRPSDGNNANPSNDQGEYHHPQDFVNVKLEPGEWDRFRKDPLARPAWRPDSKVKIMSPEDFENQPAVAFSDEYDSLHDAMIILSWMDHPTYDRIYQRYCQLMVTMSERKPGTLSSTSHEFVMRVLAQEFHITAKRAAGVVQLRHNEEQIRKTNPDLIYDDVAEFVDMGVKENIAEAYAGVNEVHPEEFIETPALIGGTGNSPNSVILPDLYDQDELWEQALLREAEDARIIIDTHIYVEDKEDATVPVKLTAEYQKTMKKKEELEFERQVLEEKAEVDMKAIPTPLPESGRVPRRERSTYVAFMMNTRDLKKLTPAQRRRKRKEKQQYQNILIEHDGELRAATLAEVKKTSAKPSRTSTEMQYAGVKKAWLERVTKQTKGVWGPQEAPTKTISNEE
jgi:hypothetical protein